MITLLQDVSCCLSLRNTGDFSTHLHNFSGSEIMPEPSLEKIQLGSGLMKSSHPLIKNQSDVAGQKTKL